MKEEKVLSVWSFLQNSTQLNTHWSLIVIMMAYVINYNDITTFGKSYFFSQATAFCAVVLVMSLHPE